MDVAQSLKQSFLFKDVPDPVLQILARVAEQVTFQAGATIASEADKPDAIFVIRNGTVRASSPGEKTPPVLFGTGQTIGAASFVDGDRAGMDAVAVERVDMLVIRAHKLGAALEADPRTGYHLYRAISKSLAGRLRRAVGMIAFSREKQD